MPLRFVLKSLLRHKLRTGLTIASLTVAIFLLCVLRSLVVSLDAGVRAATSDRLVVQSATSLWVSLPDAYMSRLREVDGVGSVSRLQWFGGYYQDPSNFFGQFGIDQEVFLEQFPEIVVVEGSEEDFLADRRACLVGKQTADQHGFEVGDTVPIIGQIFPRNDGRAWEFQVAGIYEVSSIVWDETTIFFHYDYLEEALDAGATFGPRGTSVYYLKLDGTVDGVTVAAEVDALYENGPQKVQTTTESEFNAQFVSMIGNIPLLVNSIGGGVIAAILLAVVNTMLMVGREQTRDVGVLKALGFTDGAVFLTLLSQGIAIALLGGGLGVGLALASNSTFEAMLAFRFPGYAVTSTIAGQAIALAVGIGLVAGLVPAARARKLLAVDALRRGA